MKNGPYELVVAPSDYPGRRYRDRYVYEHHLIWWRCTGQVVPEGYLVHHKNEKKRDNRFKNLELKKRGDHTRDHATPAPVTRLNCSWCRNEFERAQRVVRAQRKLGQEVFFCGRSCQVRQQHARRRLSP